MLPTREEYMKQLQFEKDTPNMEWDKKLFECPQCGGGVKCDFSVSYMCNPPKRKYFCPDCNYFTIF